MGPAGREVSRGRGGGEASGRGHGLARHRRIDGTYTSYIGVLDYHSFGKFWTIRNCELGETDESDLALRATGRPPSRTPLSQSASALLNVKAFNLGIKVHQNCALPRVDLPSSTWQQPGHLGFMLHACREWLHRQVPLLVS